MCINKEYYFQKGRKKDFLLSLQYISSQYYFFLFYFASKANTVRKNFLLDEVVSLEPQLDF